MASDAASKHTVLGQLADFAAKASVWHNPETLWHARRALIDWMAATMAGTTHPPAAQLLASIGAERGAGHSSLVGFGGTAFAATAAWINGTTSHAAELDDIYREAITHPGSPTIAAALAIAEEQDCAGTDVLAAIAAGYEVLGRVGRVMQPAHSEMYHATGTLGCLGAATASALLLAPGRADVLLNALATAATFASGLQAAVRSETMTKPLHAGHAAAVGVRCALAAHAGVTGSHAILEAAAGFGAVLTRRPVDWAAATAGLGERLVIAAPTHKIHACCGHLFPVIDTIIDLRTRHGINVAAVTSVTVTTYQAALDATARHTPRSVYECKFSMPYVIAQALAHGAVGVDAFSAARRADPQVQALMARCILRADDGMSAAFPGQRHAEVCIELASGQTLRHARSVRRGDPEAPLNDADLSRKFLATAEPVIGAGPAAHLLERLWTFDRGSVRALDLAKDRTSTMGEKT